MEEVLAFSSPRNTRLALALAWNDQYYDVMIRCLISLQRPQNHIAFHCFGFSGFRE